MARRESRRRRPARARAGQRPRPRKTKINDVPAGALRSDANPFSFLKEFSDRLKIMSDSVTIPLDLPSLQVDARTLPRPDYGPRELPGLPEDILPPLRQMKEKKHHGVVKRGVRKLTVEQYRECVHQHPARADGHAMSDEVRRRHLQQQHGIAVSRRTVIRRRQEYQEETPEAT